MANFMQKIKIGMRKFMRMVDGADKAYEVDSEKYPALAALFNIAKAQADIEEFDTDPDLRQELTTNKMLRGQYNDLKRDIERYTKNLNRVAPNTDWAKTREMFKQKQREARKSDAYNEKIFMFIDDRITEYSNKMKIVRNNLLSTHSR